MQTEVKEILERELGLEPKIIGDVVKAHATKLNGNDIIVLNDIYMSDGFLIKGIELKRSGTGITILITFEESED
jgi:hypothetical protein